MATLSCPEIHRGGLVAASLAGAWRPAPPPPSLSPDELAAIAPMLLQSGSAPLAWRRLRGSELRTSVAAAQLQDAYRYHALEATFHARDIAEAVAALRSADVEPLLAKGWAVARLYPEPGLRPYRDIDLCVRPAQYAAAQRALVGRGVAYTPVDLHSQFVDLSERDPDVLYERSQLVRLDDVEVRILGPEVHLRLLCLHLLRHGARRPLWLCDIGVMLESLPADFDPTYCLHGDRRRSAWVCCVIGLAHRLLGARLDRWTVDDPGPVLPGWLVPGILREWGGDFRPKAPRLTGAALRRPGWLLAGLSERWPSPIEATYCLGGPPDPPARLPFQIASYLGRALAFAVRAARAAPRQRPRRGR